MTEILIETAVSVAATLLITLIGVFGAWLTVKIGKRQELASITSAQTELIELARQTVGELQQTIVDKLKAAHDDGKLTNDEITMLGTLLLEKTKAKLSAPAAKVLTAACVDINALIRGAGESLIGHMHF